MGDIGDELRAEALRLDLLLHGYGDAVADMVQILAVAAVVAEQLAGVHAVLHIAVGQLLTGQLESFHVDRAADDRKAEEHIHRDQEHRVAVPIEGVQAQHLQPHKHRAQQQRFPHDGQMGQEIAQLSQRMVEQSADAVPRQIDKAVFPPSRRLAPGGDGHGSGQKQDALPRRHHRNAGNRRATERSAADKLACPRPQQPHHQRQRSAEQQVYIPRNVIHKAQRYLVRSLPPSCGVQQKDIEHQKQHRAPRRAGHRLIAQAIHRLGVVGKHIIIVHHRVRVIDVLAHIAGDHHMAQLAASGVRTFGRRSGIGGCAVTHCDLMSRLHAAGGGKGRVIVGGLQHLSAVGRIVGLTGGLVILVHAVVVIVVRRTDIGIQPGGEAVLIGVIGQQDLLGVHVLHRKEEIAALGGKAVGVSAALLRRPVLLHQGQRAELRHLLQILIDALAIDPVAEGVQRDAGAVPVVAGGIVHRAEAQYADAHADGGQHGGQKFYHTAACRIHPLSASIL